MKKVGGKSLYYIGQTGRSLRDRLRALSTHTLAHKMPFNDPHTAAPNLWAWRKTHRVQFECSVAPIELAKPLRLGLESYLLWKYRIEWGESPLCNLGRFHPNFTRPGNRSTARAGKCLAKGEVNPAGGPSAPPLRKIGVPSDPNWLGLEWFKYDRQELPDKGLYKIVHKHKSEVVYIGQSKNLRLRIVSHLRRNWGMPIDIWCVKLDGTCLDHHLYEVENDLIAAFYSQTKTVPRWQFMNGKA